MRLRRSTFLLRPSRAPAKQRQRHRDSSSFVLRGSIAPESECITPLAAELEFVHRRRDSPRAGWLALSETLAHPWAGMDCRGGLALKMRGCADRGVHIFVARTIDFRSLAVNAPDVSPAVRFPRAHIEFTTGSASDYFVCGRSSGRGVARHDHETQTNDGPFDLSADHLDAADLDRSARATPGPVFWLVPLARIRTMRQVQPATLRSREWRRTGICKSETSSRRCALKILVVKWNLKAG